MFSAPTTDGSDCAQSLLAQFFERPRRAVDTSCQDRLVPLDFDGPPGVTEAFLGTSDAWGD